MDRSAQLSVVAEALGMRVIFDIAERLALGNAAPVTLDELPQRQTSSVSTSMGATQTRIL